MPIIAEESGNKSEKSDARSGIMKTRKTLNFDRDSSGSKLVDLSATPITIGDKEEDEEIKVSKFEHGSNEKKNQKLEHKGRARTVKQNFVKVNLKKGYHQKDRRIKTRLSKYTNKRRRIMNERFANMKVNATGADGGFGSEGLDGAFVSEYAKQNKIIPLFSPKYTDDYVRPEPLDIPTTDEEYLSILKNYFGFDTFFEGQLEAIKSIIERNESCLSILSTGGGKSLIYQYCSLFMKGLVVVISPLISLMTDQLLKLPECISGCCFNSYQNLEHKREVMNALSNNKMSIIFLSPERLIVEDFGKYKQEISMVCIDEIHCSSEWSHNFRPSYLKLEDVISNRLQCSIILGLTATATKDTEKALVREYDFKKVIRHNDLSRMNLSLCITREDNDCKMQNLCRLIKSSEYKNCKSIIIYCTYKYTTDSLARYLTQQGIESKSYHAGKTDIERQHIQECFNKNTIRCIVCTIAFSMGIDKRDVNSVIHYDMPQSIESYVQEIGRAGRDGKLAKCHLIINDQNYYQLRQLILKNILDSEVALKFTLKIIQEIKEVAINHKINISMGKRKYDEIEDDDKENKFEVSEGSGEIIFENPKYVFISVDDLISNIDITKEAALTLFSYLENYYLQKDGDYFIRLFTCTPIIMNLRFYKESAEKVAEESLFVKHALEDCRIKDGVYKCSIPRICYKMKIPPFEIPRILNDLQYREKLTFDLEKDSFCFHAYRLKSNIPEISNMLYDQAMKIEDNAIRKLNSIYIASRRLSVKSIDYVLKVRESQKKIEEGTFNRIEKSLAEVNIEHSNDMNQLINTYFLTDDFENIEHVLAGEMEVNDFIPVKRIDSSKEIRDLSEHVVKLSNESRPVESTSFSDNKTVKGYTCIEIVKILLGISSKSITIALYKDNTSWGRYKEYDYKDVMKYVREEWINYTLKSIDLKKKPSVYESKRMKEI